MIRSKAFSRVSATATHPGRSGTRGASPLVEPFLITMILKSEVRGFTMTTTAQEIYIHILRTLPPTERLRLANLILNDLVDQNLSIIDQSNSWTEQDQIDITKFSLQYAATIFPEDEEISE